MKISRQILWLVFIFISSTPSSANDQVHLPKESDVTTPNTLETAIQARQYGVNELIEQHLNDLAAEYEEKGFRSEYKVGNIDPYHAQKTCDVEPEVKVNRPPLNQTRITSEIKCTSSKPWKLYVNSEFNLFSQTVTAANNIRRGQVITESDIELKETIINKNHYSLYHRLEEVIGMVAKRTIRAESNIQPSHLSPPKLVQRGDNVVIVASNSAISVKMNGTALSDGALGQQISVRNLQSKRIVKARVSKVGLVTITL